MSTTSIDPFVEYLVQKENLRVALQIAGRIDDVRIRIRESFMDEIETKLKEELSEELKSGWVIQQKETGSQSESRAGVCILPERGPNEKTPRYAFQIEQEWNIYHGIVLWEGTFKEGEKRAPFLQEAREKMVPWGYKCSDRPHASLGWKYTSRTFTSLNAALIYMVENREEFAQECARIAAEDFREHLAPLILKLNAS